MLQEQIAGDIYSSNLAWDDNYQKAIDRIAARGMIDPLGAELLRFKFGGDNKAGLRALHLLARKSKTVLKIELSYARALAIAAIQEFWEDKCDKCNGTGFFGVYKCSKCDGSGERNFSDRERALAAGVPSDSWGQHTKKFDGVVTCLRGSVADAKGKLNRLLKENIY